MGCGCENQTVNGQPVQYVAVLPGGKRRMYNSEVARDALVKNTPGAYSLPTPIPAPAVSS